MLSALHCLFLQEISFHKPSHPLPITCVFLSSAEIQFVMFTVQLLLLTISLQIIKDVQEPGGMIGNFPAVNDSTINFLCTSQVVRMEITQLRIQEGLGEEDFYY